MTAVATKRVYLFHEGNAKMRDLLGGKGANLAEMTNIGLPVPPGFTITTEVCNEYYANGQKLPAGLMDDVRAAMKFVEEKMGRTFGGSHRPLLVSVRSGAKFSMPGMMDTILNLGLNETTAKALIEETNNPRFVYDAYRRFIMMFSDVVLGLSKHDFDNKILQAYKEQKGYKSDLEMSAEDWKLISEKFLEYVREKTGRDFPTDPYEQLELAIEAVFKSWNNERAIVYRRTEKIPDNLGTAVNVQAMVFGNAGDDSGTGVAFTRDPSTGEKVMFGEYLMNAQGEDVVAGVRTPVPISELQSQNPELYRQFVEICNILERHYRDMQDLEFTIEHGRLFMLQCRSGKRTGPAAVKIAVDMVHEGLITKEEAVTRVTGSHLDQLLHPRIDPKALEGKKPLITGIPASPGAAVGKVVFDADTAAKLGVHGGAGEKVILVRDETNPDDVHGMLASQGVLTARGGKTSHAAVVARGFGIPCVVGAEGLKIDEEAKTFTVNGTTVHEGDVITLDGSTGAVYLGALPLIAPEVSGAFAELMSWADSIRKLRVRTNADNPRDARQAVELGAEGIGLCRTEHMFFEQDRLPIVQEMILAQDEAVRQNALDRLLPIQQKDFEEIFEVMAGKPVTIRLIDPPLHEFLPSHDELLAQVVELRVRGDNPQELAEKEKLLRAVEGMREANPMMGLRGCRLSIVFPGIVEMQTRAILQAAVAVKKRGIDVYPEIMIPLVGHVNELKTVRANLERVAKKVIEETGVAIDYKFGTMIEIPRAALVADQLADPQNGNAEFFSFGTNDLTQMTFGFSRDDAGKFLVPYLEQKILPTDPFETIDQEGVGKLMHMATESAKRVRPDIKLGICGEHGGDPDSVKFCHRIGLDYVSCSPFRVPIARLAAAQAAIENAAEGDK
ncbi:pyruvate, phosphate dikinase [Chthonomonas calidirosea]|uniref:pyruvate, phosphate dikinase n=1 Tax=Chthonomonas calidirosea TaxID=454171 RepID=UPI0006EC8364|nr:pyruvate, phosphate dikinase [Chthonomonas calidirosea]CEK19405.1 pyruvate phosphate dikinase [Chthonomonas calidirosea]